MPGRRIIIVVVVVVEDTDAVVRRVAGADLSHTDFCTHIPLFDLLHFDRLDVSFPTDPIGSPDRLYEIVTAALATTHKPGRPFTPTYRDGSPTSYSRGTWFLPRTRGDMLVDLLYDRLNPDVPAFKLRFRHRKRSHHHLHPIQAWALVEQVYAATCANVPAPLLTRYAPFVSSAEIAHDIIVDDPHLILLLLAFLDVPRFRKLQFRGWQQWVLVGGHKSRFRVRVYVRGSVLRVEVMLTKRGLRHLQIRTVNDLLRVQPDALRGHSLTPELDARRDLLLGVLQHRLLAGSPGSELAVATCADTPGLPQVPVFQGTQPLTSRCSSRTAERARHLGASWNSVATAIGRRTARRLSCGRPVLRQTHWARHIVPSYEVKRLLRGVDIQRIANWTVPEAREHAARLIPELQIALHRARSIGERMTLVALLESAVTADRGFAADDADHVAVFQHYGGALIFALWMIQIAEPAKSTAKEKTTNQPAVAAVDSVVSTVVTGVPTPSSGSQDPGDAPCRDVGQGSREKARRTPSGRRVWQTGPAYLARELTAAKVWQVSGLEDVLVEIAPLSFTRAQLVGIVRQAWARDPDDSVDLAAAFLALIAAIKAGKTTIWRNHEDELSAIKRTVQSSVPRPREVEVRGRFFWRHFPRQSVHLAVGVLIAQHVLTMHDVAAITTDLPGTPGRTDDAVWQRTAHAGHRRRCSLGIQPTSRCTPWVRGHLHRLVGAPRMLDAVVRTAAPPTPMLFADSP